MRAVSWGKVVRNKGKLGRRREAGKKGRREEGKKGRREEEEEEEGRNKGYMNESNLIPCDENIVGIPVVYRARYLLYPNTR